MTVWPGPSLEPGGAGCCLVTHRPQDLPPEALLRVDVIVAVGGASDTDPIVDLVAAGGGMSHEMASGLLASAGSGRAVLVDRREPGLVFTLGPRATAHVRHWHKYAMGRLPAERRFYFRNDWDNAAGITAANIEELEHRLRSCSEGIIAHHCAHADFSRWISDVLGDPQLANDINEAEGRLRARSTTPANARLELLEAIHRGTTPADRAARPWVTNPRTPRRLADGSTPAGRGRAQVIGDGGVR